MTLTFGIKLLTEGRRHNYLSTTVNCKKKKFTLKKKKLLPASGHFDYRWKTENLVRSSPYSWVTSHKKLERCNNYFSSYRVNKTFFWIFDLDLWPMTSTFGKKLLPEGLNVCTVESCYSANRYTAISVITRYARGHRFLHGEIWLKVSIFYSWSRQSG